MCGRCKCRTAAMVWWHAFISERAGDRSLPRRAEPASLEGNVRGNLPALQRTSHNRSSGLAAQLRKSATSVPSNVAEGRESENELCRFFRIAAGSAGEFEYPLFSCSKADK